MGAAFDTRWSDPRNVEIAFAGVAVLGWAIVAATAPKPPALGGHAGSYAAYDEIAVALFVVALAAGAAWLSANRRRGRRRPI
jgi:hypothetical protein